MGAYSRGGGGGGGLFCKNDFLGRGLFEGGGSLFKLGGLFEDLRYSF